MKEVKNTYKKKIQPVLTDPFWKNVGNLFSGSVIGQALPLLIFPILTRIYPKTIFDVYFIYSSIILLTQIISNLQYHYALLLPKKDSSAKALLFLNIAISISISGVLMILIILTEPLISKGFQSPELTYWLYFTPVSTLFLGLSETFFFYLNRLRKYSYISLGRITKGVVLIIAQTTFGVLGYSTNGLLYGLLIGQGMSTFLILFFIIKSDKTCFVFDKSSILLLAKQYKDMPLYNTLISFISNFSSQLPVFLLTRYYGNGASGDFGMANKIVNTPMGIVSQSIGQVFYKEVSDIMHTKKDLNQFVIRMYKNMFKIGIIPFTILLLFSPWLFNLIFSDAYLSSGLMAQILIPFYFLSFVNNPISGLLTMLNKQKIGVIYQIGLLFGRLLAISIGILLFNNVLITIGFFSLVGVIFNIILYFYLLRISKIKKSNYHK